MSSTVHRRHDDSACRSMQVHKQRLGPRHVCTASPFALVVHGSRHVFMIVTLVVWVQRDPTKLVTRVVGCLLSASLPASVVSVACWLWSIVRVTRHTIVNLTWQCVHCTAKHTRTPLQITHTSMIMTSPTVFIFHEHWMDNGRVDCS